jgi:hypothetical protein
MVLGDFAVKYNKLAKKLGVSIKDIHDALISDSFTTPKEWNSFGRQISGQCTFTSESFPLAEFELVCILQLGESTSTFPLVFLIASRLDVRLGRSPGESIRKRWLDNQA